MPEVPFHVFEVLVRGDHGGRVELGGGDGSAQHIEPVQGGFGVDLVLLAGDRQGVSVMVTAKCLPVLYLVITLPTSTPIGPAPTSRPAATRLMRGGAPGRAERGLRREPAALHLPPQGTRPARHGLDQQAGH